MESTFVVQVRKLTKTFKRRIPSATDWRSRMHDLFRPRYERITALHEVSFDIESGDIVGYIGMNGAGKSTTIKCLCGILVPTSGYVTVAGITPHRSRTELACLIGVVFGQKPQLWWDVPPRATYEVLRVMYDIDQDRYRQRLSLLSDILDLDPILDVPVRQLSLGQRMRADLAAALLHDPQILLLDEPTIGLDFEGKERIRVFLRELNRDKHVTVMIASHDLDDIQQLATRIMIIDRGDILFYGGIEELLSRFAPYRNLRIDFRVPPASLQLPTGVEIAGQTGLSYHLRIPRNARVRDIVVGLGWNDIVDFSVEEPGISDVVRAIRKEEGR